MATPDTTFALGADEAAARERAVTSRLEMRVAQRAAMGRGAPADFETLLKAVEQARFNPVASTRGDDIHVAKADWDRIVVAARRCRR